MICFAWYELPQYGAREINAFCKMNPNEDVVVISPRPDVPLDIKRIEECAGCRVIWLERHTLSLVKIPDCLGSIPKVFVQTGWYVPAFNAVGAACKARGGLVIAMNDTNYEGTPSAFFRALRFRFWGYPRRVRRMFDGYMVPGRSGHRLHRLYGIPDDKIIEGLNGADPNLFCDGGPLHKRPKRFLFVGRLSDLKNILMVVDVFLKFTARYPDWKLDICGSGLLKERIPRHPAIELNEFVQPEELHLHYQTARCMVLASHWEHWGLVVHEATLSGCFLLLSEKVGCIPDFAGRENALLFSPKSERELLRQMVKVAELTEPELERARETSLRLSKKFSPEVFSRNLTAFIQRNNANLAH
jgi:glycosyltransferase involved in cell wall biosynthesis